MIVVAVGMQSEAALLPPDVRPVVSGGRPERLRGLLEGLGPEVTAVLSFGIAGGLDPLLECGDLVVATRVRGPEGAWLADPAWGTQLVRATAARPGVVAGVAQVVATPAAKRSLHAMTGALVVDTESQVAAAFAATRSLPFAALRAVADTSAEVLPACAAVGLTEDGRPAPFKVLMALARRPGEFGALMQVARRAEAAEGSLRHAVTLLRGKLRRE